MDKNEKSLSVIEKIIYSIVSFFLKKSHAIKNNITRALVNDSTFFFDNNIFDALQKFHDCSVKDIMNQRTEICAVSINSCRSSILEKIKNNSYTKILIYRNGLDNIIGFFYVKDFILKNELDLKSIMRDVIFVPQSMKVTNLLLQMKSTKSRIAIVLDEYGGTDGLISLSDLVQGIIYNITNVDKLHIENTFIEVSKNKFEISARTLIKELENMLKVKLCKVEEDYVTVGGLVYSIINRIPLINEIIEYKYGIKFIVKDVDERCIYKIIVDLSEYKINS
ncbi:transporter associated domain-containing protein [Wolbachia endosymbiont of Pentidionis agamae]|uniref:transporter associated domain-containing protein n=1 Tax=Wolbachia endosymbiont of Pentidionis agamae TaxID=3110435 RepID=UPI002FD4B705